MGNVREQLRSALGALRPATGTKSPDAKRQRQLNARSVLIALLRGEGFRLGITACMDAVNADDSNPRIYAESKALATQMGRGNSGVGMHLWRDDHAIFRSQENAHLLTAYITDEDVVHVMHVLGADDDAFVKAIQALPTNEEVSSSR